MWTNTIDETAGNFCRALNSVAGHFPSACQVDAGRPALYLALSGALAIVTIAILVWKTTRRA